MKKENTQTKENQNFLDFIQKGTSPYQVVSATIDTFEKEGFLSLEFGSSWDLVPGGKYYTKPYDTTLFAFRMPEQVSDQSRFRMCASHTDHPGFRLKPNPDIKEKGYWKLNVETYGGVILNTWLDRPLSMAGKVTLKSNDIFKPECRLVDWKSPLLSIPNLAIHMNRSVNSGLELNKQVDLLPLFSMSLPELNEHENFLSYLAEQLEIETEDILDFDLYVYNCEKGCVFGKDKEFYSSPRLDNLTSVYAGINALCNANLHGTDIAISAFYDNEEIGSRTKQGADSAITQMLLHKIASSCGLSEQQLQDCIYKSFMISTDVAHALHPNHGEKNDITNYTLLNQGVVIKINADQRYATDTEAIGVIQQICQRYQIPYQKFVNRSDITGGGTLGTITSSWLPMKTVDIGVPILAMHSAREMSGVKDVKYLSHLLCSFFECK